MLTEDGRGRDSLAACWGDSWLAATPYPNRLLALAAPGARSRSRPSRHKLNRSILLNPEPLSTRLYPRCGWRRTPMARFQPPHSAKCVRLPASGANKGPREGNLPRLLPKPVRPCLQDSMRIGFRDIVLLQVRPAKRTPYDDTVLRRLPEALWKHGRNRGACFGA